VSVVSQTLLPRRTQIAHFSGMPVKLSHANGMTFAAGRFDARQHGAVIVVRSNGVVVSRLPRKKIDGSSSPNRAMDSERLHRRQRLSVLIIVKCSVSDIHWGRTLLVYWHFADLEWPPP
jgi:hypothetical protein